MTPTGMLRNLRQRYRPRTTPHDQAPTSLLDIEDDAESDAAYDRAIEDLAAQGELHYEPTQGDIEELIEVAERPTSDFLGWTPDPKNLDHTVRDILVTELSVPAFSVDDLAASTGVADLGTRLRAASIRFVKMGEKTLVLTDDWYRYLGEVIRASANSDPNSEMSSIAGFRIQVAPSFNDADRQGDADDHVRSQPVIRAESWDDYRRDMFGRYPWLAELLERFVAHLLEQRPVSVINQTRSTVTIIQPNGGWVGLYPKPAQGGLRLRAIRKGEPHYEFIKSDEDFVRVIEWLDQLPGYRD